MNINFKNILAAFTIATALVACQGAPNADKATVSDKQNEATASGTNYKIDTATSEITWVGTKPVGQHEGTFNLNEGTLIVQNGEIVGGNFTIDILSLNNKDLEGETKGMLEGHLKGADFFDVEKYPTATFTITDVQPFDSTTNRSLLAGATHFISGNLKLKDSTKNISFPAVVQKQGNAITAKANFNIDRTNWGMSYGNDKSLQDKFIRPEVNLQLNITALDQ
ncbi:MAG TPA: YceI family protein [Flavisolibacter sp.]|nr:YceI family protein [Flavisolibacter sp.]